MSEALHVTRRPEPYVGIEGSGTLLIQMDIDSASIQVSPATYLIMLIGFGFFGPGMLVLYSRFPDHFQTMSLGWRLFVFLLIGVLSLAFLSILRTFLWRRPTVIIGKDALRYRMAKKEIKVVSKTQLKEVFITERWVRPGAHIQSRASNWTANYLLTLLFQDESEDYACLSRDKKQIDALIDFMRQKGYPAENKTVADTWGRGNKG